MYKIIGKQLLNAKTRRIEIEAPQLCARLRAGHFITVTPFEKSFPCALGTVDVDPVKGTLIIVFNETLPSLQMLGRLKIGDFIFSIDGPFAQRIAIKKYGRVLCVSEDNYILNNLALCRLLRKEGNKVLGIAGFQKKEDIILESQFRSNCDDAHVSAGVDVCVDLLRKAFTSQMFDCVFAVGSVSMLRQIKQEAAKNKIKCKINLIALLEYGLKSNLESSLRINNERTFFDFSPLVLAAKDVDLNAIAEQIQELKEYEDCQPIIIEQTRPADRLKIFPRLFAGLRKEKR